MKFPCSPDLVVAEEYIHQDKMDHSYGTAAAQVGVCLRVVEEQSRWVLVGPISRGPSCGLLAPAMRKCLQKLHQVDN